MTSEADRTSFDLIDAVHDGCRHGNACNDDDEIQYDRYDADDDARRCKPPAVAAALLDLVLADDGADQPDNGHQEREDEPDDRKYVGLRCRR